MLSITLRFKVSGHASAAPLREQLREAHTCTNILIHVQYPPESQQGPDLFESTATDVTLIDCEALSLTRKEILLHVHLCCP